MVGEFAYPMTLRQIASDTRIASGHHAYLRGGNYTYGSTILFTRNGVVYAPYANEQPVIQPSTSGINITADDVTITGIEFAGINTNRVSAQGGSNPTDIDYFRLLITGKRVTLAGCIIHDITALNVDHAATSFTLRDCIIYNVGWYSTIDGWHDHQLYGQSDGGGALVIENCIFGPSGAYSIHFYGVNGNLIGLHVTNLINLNHKLAIGGEVNAPLDDVIMTNSVLWNVAASTVLGRSSANCGSLTLTDNYFGLTAPSISPAWQSVTNTGNVTGSGGANVVKVFPCTTANKIAHIAVMNWQELDAVDATVDGLTAGDNYRLRDAYNPLGNVSEFTYEGGAVVLPFTGRSVAKPLGFDTAVATLDPRFGAWQLESAG